jgi:hypothetical protein
VIPLEKPAFFDIDPFVNFSGPLPQFPNLLKGLSSDEADEETTD